MQNNGQISSRHQLVIEEAFNIIHIGGYQQQSIGQIAICYMLAHMRAGLPFEIFTSSPHSVSSSQWASALANWSYSGKPTEMPSNGSTLHRAYEMLIAETLKLEQPILNRLLDLLASLRLPSMEQEEYAMIFDFAIEYPSRSNRAYSNEWVLPQELIKVITQIFPASQAERILIPYAGVAQFVNYIDKQTPLLGIEPNSTIAALGTLHLAAHRFHHSSIEIGDPIVIWPNGISWDLVLVSNLVFDSRPVEMPSGEYPALLQRDVALIQLIIKNLNSGGRAVVPVAAGFLFRGSSATYELRKNLVEAGWLQAVVEFPSGILTSTGVIFSLLVLGKNYREDNRPRFIDAGSFTTAQGRQKVLDAEALLGVIKGYHPSESAVSVTRETLVANDYNLSPRRYLSPEETHPDDTLLSEIATPVRTNGRNNAPMTGRLVSIRSLKNDDLQFQLDIVDQSVEYINKAVTLLTEDVLLVALRGNTLKPTWYTYNSDDQAVVSSEIAALRLDATKVNVAYLVTELNSDYVMKQVKARQIGSTISNLSRKDLLSLRLRLPKSLAQQEAVVSSLWEQMIKQKQKEVDALRDSRTRKAETFQQFAALKHSLGQPQQNLASGVARLEHVIRRYGSANTVLTLDSPMSAAETTTVQNTIDALKRAVDFIYRTLNRNEHELVLENYPLDAVEMIGYLRRLVMRTNATARSFSTSFKGSQELLLLEVFDKSKQSEIYVQANEHLLDLLFGNILDNADRHGFKGTRNADNKVAIHAAYTYFDDTVSPKLQIRVSNNGEPFPLNFDPSQLFRKGEPAGETGNTGIGGYEVQEIVRYFGGEVKASSSTKYPDSAVVYTITLPLSAAETADPDVEDV
ncbi:N-6 DNA methylase [Hymenobacter artigasi]|uniref:site-specific DNA-methyltransferase (adenine-specific) n=1 Tax=Hymenobacter artigasi TaxID=2719616 RepID=A0ABX1HH10_9BACT|nr:N-6 DNA methylase [Hymenobacter artigasi]NKI89487.1 type I restriction enzyme M protein [Hymenobacter artigasi]